MDAPLVSVIVPTYNYASFLPEAIGSVASQTYPNMELICVDDCSTDNTTEVLRNLARTYEDRFRGGIRLFRHVKNQGAHAALNSGISCSSGDILSILNADDMYEKNRLELAVAAMQKTSSPFAFTAVRCIDARGTRVRTSFAAHVESLPARGTGMPSAAPAAVAENLAVSTGNMIFRKELAGQTGPFAPYKYVHDYDFFFRVILAHEPVFVPETAYLYRLHGNNSFTQLQNVGITENRLVWLDRYAQIKRGDVSNPALLSMGSPAEVFRRAAAEYGFQKKVMWTLAGTRAGKVLGGLLARSLPYIHAPQKNAGLHETGVCAEIRWRAEEDSNSRPFGP